MIVLEVVACAIVLVFVLVRARYGPDPLPEAAVAEAALLLRRLRDALAVDATAA